MLLRTVCTLNRTKLFRAITQCVTVIPFRIFGTTSNVSQLQLTIGEGTDSLSRNVGITTRNVIAKKNAVTICFVLVARNLACVQ